MALHPIHEKQESERTFGQRTADAVTAAIGSWTFIITQSLLLILWIILNVTWLIHRHWDPYPFILLNLTLSFQAAYTGPIVMMSQNRASERDRQLARHDYQVNLQALEKLQMIVERLEKDADYWECCRTCKECDI